MDSTVNPELGSWTLDQRVVTFDAPDINARLETLFGLTGDALQHVVGAVRRFLVREPGSFDHVMLRLVAASSSVVGDGEQVARLIDGIPVTGMNVASATLDLAALREEFIQVLGRSFGKDLSRWPIVRARMVRDLIQQTQWEVLVNAPAEAVTAAGRELVVRHVRQQLRGPIGDLGGPLSSGLATGELIDRALDVIEQRIKRDRTTLDAWLAGGSVGEKPLGIALQLVSDALLTITGKPRDVVDQSQLRRVRRIADAVFSRQSDDLRGGGGNQEAVAFQREHLRSGFRRILRAIVDHPNCDQALMLECGSDFGAVDWSDDDANGMLIMALGRSDISLDAARQMAVRTGAAESLSRALHRPPYQWRNNEMIDARLVAVRLFAVAYPRERASIGAIRDSVELDRVVARLPARFLVPPAVVYVADEVALDALCRRTDLNTQVAWALSGNEHLGPRQVDILRANRWVRNFELARIRGASEAQLLTGLDAGLAAFDVGRAAGSGRGSVSPQAAALHPSAGAEVLAYVRNTTEGLWIMRGLAYGSRKRSVHVRMVALVCESGNSELAGLLAHNPFVGRSAYRPLERRFPELRQLPLDFTVGENDVPDLTRMIESGTIRTSVLDELVDRLVKGEHNEERRRVFALVTKAADSGRLLARHWRALTALDDLHEKLLFATHVEAPDRVSAYQTVGQRLLERTVRAVDGAHAKVNDDPRTWSDLLSAQKFPESRFVNLVDGTTLAGVTLRVLRTSAELDEAAKFMGNCLDGYEEQAARGGILIAIGTSADGQTYAVGWWIRNDNLELHHVNSRFNLGNVSPEFSAALTTFTDQSHEHSMLDPSGLLKRGRTTSGSIVPKTWHVVSEDATAHLPPLFGVNTTGGAIAAITVHAERNASRLRRDRVRDVLASVALRNRDQSIPVVQSDDDAVSRAVVEGVRQHLFRIGLTIGAERAQNARDRLRRELIPGRDRADARVDSVLYGIANLVTDAMSDVHRRVEKTVGRRRGTVNEFIRGAITEGAERGAREVLSRVPGVDLGGDIDMSSTTAKWDAVQAWRSASPIELAVRSALEVQPAMRAAEAVLEVVPQADRRRLLERARSHSRRGQAGPEPPGADRDGDTGHDRPDGQGGTPRPSVPRGDRDPGGAEREVQPAGELLPQLRDLPGGEVAPAGGGAGSGVPAEDVRQSVGAQGAAGFTRILGRLRPGGHQAVERREHDRPDRAHQAPQGQPVVVVGSTAVSSSALVTNQIGAGQQPAPSRSPAPAAVVNRTRVLSAAPQRPAADAPLLVKPQQTSVQAVPPDKPGPADRPEAVVRPTAHAHPAKVPDRPLALNAPAREAASAPTAAGTPGSPGGVQQNRHQAEPARPVEPDVRRTTATSAEVPKAVTAAVDAPSR